jgi:hypothetical protein
MQTTDIAQALSAPLTESQESTSTAYQHAVNRQQAVIQTLQMEQRRAAALHGPESPRVQRIQTLVNLHQQSLALVQSQAARTQARTPQPNPQEFIIYGYVTSKSGAAASGIEVAAVDDKGTLVRAASTDNTGAYAIHIPKPGSRTTGTAASETGTKASSKQTITNLHLIARDKKKTFQISGAVTFQFEPGTLGYEDLVVPL